MFAVSLRRARKIGARGGRTPAFGPGIVPGIVDGLTPNAACAGPAGERGSEVGLVKDAGIGPVLLSLGAQYALHALYNPRPGCLSAWKCGRERRRAAGGESRDTNRCCGCGVSAVVRWTLLLWVAKGAVVGVIALIAGPSGACQSGRPPTHTGCRRMQDPASTSARLFACTGALVPDSLHRLRTQTAGGANFPFSGLHHHAKMRYKPLASPRGGSLSPVVDDQRCSSEVPMASPSVECLDRPTSLAQRESTAFPPKCSVHLLCTPPAAATFEEAHGEEGHSFVLHESERGGMMRARPGGELRTGWTVR